MSNANGTRAPLAPEAWHGPCARLARVIEPTVEAPPEVVLMTTMTAFGAIVGNRARFAVGADRHHPLLWPVIVAPTGSGKGTSLRAVQTALRDGGLADLDEITHRRITTGEKLVHLLRDPRTEKRPVYDGIGTDKRFTGDWTEEPVDPGVTEKRALFTLEELAGSLGAKGRDGNSLSSTLRESWDGGRLEAGSKASPETATGYTIAVIGHVTPMELPRLVDGLDAANGFSNRFLWCVADRGPLLATPPPVDENAVRDIVAELQVAVDQLPAEGRTLRRTDRAETRWREELIVPLGTRPETAFGEATGRARPWVMRLALLFAVADCADAIDLDHLDAAMAVWGWCERSAYDLFGDRTGDALADRLLAQLREAGPDGLPRSEVRDGLSNAQRSRLDEVRDRLDRAGLLLWLIEPPGPRGGRPVERWWATPQTPITPGTDESSAVRGVSGVIGMASQCREAS